ncbi:MAG: holo-ACP synthase [Clostridiaceae bacterium]|nr:holo-ACP synthase [Clostridiaceae bacterium]
MTCGTDIIEVKRVQEAIESLGEKFINKIFTPSEILYCNNKQKMKYQHFAARFAAKEAIFKAISELLNDKYEITWTDVEILPDENKKPRVYFLNNKHLKIKQIDISLSHIQEYATAMCVVLSEEGEK